MKNQIVIPTGYMGSGSSAMTDLLSEIETYGDNAGSYEYILMHCPDGVFDLEDKLLYGNNVIRSDEAVHRFLLCMQDLYQKKNYWPGNYKKNISKQFMKYCYDFIEHLDPIELRDTYWYFQQNPKGIRMHGICILMRVLRKLRLHKKITLNVPLRYKDMKVVIPEKEKFFYEAQNFLNNIFNDLGSDSKNLVLDQFLLPHNLCRINDYFDESLRVFVIERDPRDVFILNKYFWKKAGAPIPYPMDAEEFCRMYRCIRESEKTIIDTRILRLNFEDMVYDYEETLLRIYSFLGIDGKYHEKHKKRVFNPDISVNNTMLFKENGFYKKEIKLIEDSLADYLYDFPERYHHVSNKMVF